MRRLLLALTALVALPLSASSFHAPSPVETRTLRAASFTPPDGTVRRLGPPVLLDPGAVVLTALLPPLPASAPTSVGALPIVRTMTPCHSDDNFGCFDSIRWVIEIRDSLPPVVGWITLHHEVQHAAFFLAGLKFDTPKAEDVVADAVAGQQVLEMRAGWPQR